MSRPKNENKEPFSNVAARLPRDLVDRLDAVAAKLAQRAMGMAPSQSHAIRVVLERGIGPIEAELAEPAPKRK
ncbi:MAG: hypothetical protein JW751_08635 [Polyangiaceae bacterium]|nr:hypothetical protein [Polyangiaceae bacterium]